MTIEERETECQVLSVAPDPWTILLKSASAGWYMAVAFQAVVHRFSLIFPSARDRGGEGGVGGPERIKAERNWRERDGYGLEDGGSQKENPWS